MRRAVIPAVIGLAAALTVAACTPPPPPPPAGTAYDIRCPVTGEVAFSNDWHAPRAGGLLHEGNDVFAPRGRANVAVVAGVARFKTGARSGKAIWLDGDDGNDYFYAHFDSWKGTGPERRVAAGEIIGYTGNTGDAATTATHTHFEIHPAAADGEPVNPYASLAKACAGSTGVTAASSSDGGDVSSAADDGLER
jgi:murein DD-endopeptidase MepM/ murein hydrolase activator NlpD